ncbi:hypothetical protein JCM6882_000794 [Rhodosporidiobolus microsporus]
MASRSAVANLLRAAPSSRRAVPSLYSSARAFSLSAVRSDEAAAAPLSPKIAGIVDQISGLTLLEAADLVDALKSRLNIVDIALPAAAAPAASAAPAAAPADEPAAPKEKTVFNVNLTKIDAAQKAKAIREVKAIMPGMNLVEAKKFVESLPKTLKEGATKEEAEKLQALFKAIGAEVALD